MVRRRETDAVMDRPSSGQEPAGSLMGSSPETQAPQPEPTTEQIAQRAYEIFQTRGGSEGQDIEDWLEAERQLRRGPQAGTE